MVPREGIARLVKLCLTGEVSPPPAAETPDAPLALRIGENRRFSPMASALTLKADSHFFPSET